jgi:hypothetical protein
VTKAISNTLVIVTIMLPVEGQKEAESIVKSARVVQASPTQIEITVF